MTNPDKQGVEQQVENLCTTPCPHIDHSFVGGEPIKMVECKRCLTDALLAAQRAERERIETICKKSCCCIKVGDIVAEQCAACKLMATLRQSGG